MVEKEQGGKKSGGWLKAGFGAVAGILSGAAAMYATAFIDQAVKPAKPVANFRVDHDGLTVKIQNLSPGFSGWWDFGDGSELVPVAAGQDMVPHSYQQPGNYTIKMSLHNLLGEENERTVELNLTPTAAAADGAPSVDELRVEPVSPGGYAPATFKIVSKTNHAKLCVWDLGDGSDLFVEDAASSPPERFVTFQTPGAHAIRLGALNGDKHAQKSAAAQVADAPDGTLAVTLTAADSGTHVRRQTKPATFSAAFNPTTPAGKPSPFTKDLAAAPGWTVGDLTWKEGTKEVHLGKQTKVDLNPSPLGLKGVQQLHMEILPDRRGVRLTGELVRDAKDKEQPTFVLPVTLVEEQRAPDAAATTATAMLTMPLAGGPAAAAVVPPPAPAGWVDVTRTMKLEIRDGATLLQTVPLTGTSLLATPISWKNHSFLLTAAPDKDKVRLQLAAAGRPGAP
jgi:PKD repeat protein